MREFKAFIGGSYEHESYSADVERTINWRPTTVESAGATASRVLEPSPGVIEVGSHYAGPGRGHFFLEGREFAVIGPSFGEVDQFGSFSELATVANDSQPATICSNGDGGRQLFITSGGEGYCFDLTTNTTTVIAALSGRATMGAFLDGYFLCLDSSTSTLLISALLDGTSWTTGTDYAQRSMAADRWRSMDVVGRYVWLMGEQTSEVWYNSGRAFPFDPHPSSLVEFGIEAPWSKAVLGRSMFWLARGAGGMVTVVRAADMAPQEIANSQIKRVLADNSRIGQSIGCAYSEGGAQFYALYVPGHETTFMYDVAEGVWHERGTWVRGEWTQWRPAWHATAFGEQRMLDQLDGKIYKISQSHYYDAGGGPIRRMRRAPAIVSGMGRAFYSTFELLMDVGVGTGSPQTYTTAPKGGTSPITTISSLIDYDPHIMLRTSNDGGATWGPERWRPAGKVGAYRTRVAWNRLGSGRRRVFEVVATDPVPWRIAGAFLEVVDAAG